MYWEDTKTYDYGQKLVQKLMTYKRFTEIHSMKKNSFEKKRNFDEATCKIIDYLNRLCNSIYDPNEQLSIEKGMRKFQERYSFKTYMPAKSIKMSMKYYILADSKTSFVCNISLYTGKSNTINSTVKTLMNSYLNKNHKLCMDNFYNSLKLCEERREVGVYCCGAIRSNRGEPKEYKQLKNSMKKGDLHMHQKKQY
ncbi:hypothetical protein HZS_4713 [Henneguya salminicola]|nr:hypothetical protein HZS_4713 [Henneguya salminicola]